MTFAFYLLNNEEADLGFSALKSVLRSFWDFMLSNERQGGVFQHGGQHPAHLVSRPVAPVNMARLTFCHTDDACFHHSEESLFQCLVKIGKGFGETFRIEPHVIQRLFQFPGRLVFTAFLQSFRNVAETGCMQLAFQLGNGY